jgi:hypothetical protein
METFGVFRNGFSFTKIYGLTFRTTAIPLTIFVLSKLVQGIGNNTANCVLHDEKHKDFNKAFFLSNYRAVLRHTPKCNLIYEPARITAISIWVFVKLTVPEQYYGLSDLLRILPVSPKASGKYHRKYECPYVKYDFHCVDFPLNCYRLVVLS